MNILKRNEISNMAESMRGYFERYVALSERDEILAFELYSLTIEGLAEDVGLEFKEVTNYLDQKYKLGMRSFYTASGKKRGTVGVNVKEDNGLV